jgi:hypothetical protein
VSFSPWLASAVVVIASPPLKYLDVKISDGHEGEASD